MFPSTPSVAPELVPADGDIESFDGWSPVADVVLTCYSMAVEAAAS